MPNLTLAIPEELHQSMKKHTEIRWSEVARKSFSEKIAILDQIERITNKSKFTKHDVELIAKKIDSSVARKL